jgi:glycosyltransferase involved in cell wall biosynthesis
MRNEELNAAACASSVRSSQGLSHLSITALDDSSTDATAEILSKHGGVKVIHGGELPAGWMGKSYALTQLAASTSAPYLVFIDADVRITSHCIASSLALMEREKLDYLSVYPRQLTVTFIEKLMQPLLQWSFFSSLPLRSLTPFRSKRALVANGQLLFVKASAFNAVGGYIQIKSKVLDDIALAGVLTSAGYRGAVANGAEVASCRMYRSRGELNAGYQKSLWSAPGALALAALLFATNVLPFIAAMVGSAIAIAASLMLVASRVVVAKSTRSNTWSSLLHPCAILYLIYLTFSSIRLHRKGLAAWKGRKI